MPDQPVASAAPARADRASGADRPRHRMLALRYWIITLTVLVALACGALVLAGLPTAATWVGGGYALAVAAGYVVRMVRTLLTGRVGVDLLAIVAIAATVLTGEIAAALVVILMLSGGEALEDYANRRARRELDALLKRDPRSAHRLAGDEVEEVPVDAVRVGDTLLVRPSEVVPVDAVLLDAAASVDQSSITGESIPVEVTSGGALLSGSVNGAAAIRVRATALAADSQYQQIVALVAAAADSKAKVVRLADRFAVPLTVFSLLLAGAAWLLSGDPVRFAEVLVLATPCPLLIAAPVAFIGGMSRAARNGIIVRTGNVFETLARAQTIVFDKTGTLTAGHPALREVRPAPGRDADELLALTASAEQSSSHVLAASIVEAARSRGLPLTAATSAEEHATDGVLADVGGRRVGVGKRRFVEQLAPDVRREAISDGELAVYVAVDGRYAGALIERDPPRPEARAALDELRRLGLGEVELLTGDAVETARSMADELGIPSFLAECRPADKVERVGAITRRPVAMVGDGVNDAPVLARADVGIAMGAKGATAASESADVVLLIDDLAGVPRAVTIARATVRIALQSIWLGIIASVALMIVASFGVIPALAGALLQEAVDLAAILAALRAIGPASERRRTRPR